MNKHWTKSTGLLGHRPDRVGLLPMPSHPRSGLSQQAIQKKKVLLPSPGSSVQKLSRKQPLLQTPSAKKIPVSPPKTPLLQTPTMKHRKQWRSPKPLFNVEQKAIRNDNKRHGNHFVKGAGALHSPGEKRKGFFQSETKPHKEIQYNKAYQNKEVVLPTTKPVASDDSDADICEAYRLHKEKLSRINKQRPEDKKLVNVEESEEMRSKESKSPQDLSCLAKYLLEIKSLSKGPSVQELSCTAETGDCISNCATQDLTPTNMNFHEDLRKVIDDTKSSTLVNKKLGEIHDTPNVFESQINETSKDNSTKNQVADECVVASKQSSVKARKHKIQLSHYASGNDSIVVYETADEKRPKLDSPSVTTNKDEYHESLATPAEELIDLTGETIEAKQIPQTNFPISKGTLINATATEKPLTSLSPKTSSFEIQNTTVCKPRKQSTEICDLTTAPDVVSENLPDLGEQHAKDVDRTCMNTHEDNKECSSRSLPTKDIVKEGCNVESANQKSDMEDLPCIIPVKGFFCDLCCDFFFDEPSTRQHCKTASHIKQVEEASTALKEDNASESLRVQDEANNVFIRKKKQKLGAAKKDSLQPPTHGGRLSAGKNHNSVGKKSRVIDTGKRKPFDWNFVIPKRK